MTITAGYILQAAVVANDEQRGRVVEPSENKFSDADVALINADEQTKHLFAAKLLKWGATVPDDDATVPAPAEKKK